MKKKKLNFKINKDEQKFESEIENGEWTPVSKKEASRLKSEMTEATQGRNKDARVNLRLNPEDVNKIREKAELEGIPYQTLIASVLHKYATDQFLDEKAVTTVIHKMNKKIAG
jgi:predicted DNA binding CopG/RHH family protein